MRRTLIRQISVGTAVALVAAAAGGAAFASTSNHGKGGENGPRAGGIFAGGFGLGFRGGLGVGPGPGGRAFAFGFGGPGRGPGGPSGGSGILGADVLTPAATFLGIPLTTLEADLKSGKTLAQEATAKGKTAADLITAIVASEQKVLDAESAAGWITSDQETALVAELTKQVTDLVNAGPPVPPTKQAPQGGPLADAAAYLGLSVSDLQADLKAGKTLASLVASPKTVDGLVAAIEAPAKTKLDAAVTAGTITSAQETTILTRLTDRITNLVNGTKGSSNTNTVRKNLQRLTSLKTFGLKAGPRK